MALSTRQTISLARRDGVDAVRPLLGIRRPWWAPFPFVRIDANARRRSAVLAHLLDEALREDRQLVRCLVEAEIGYARRLGAAWDPTPLAMGALLLFRYGRVEDTPLLWKARTCHAAAEALLPLALLCGGGVDETISYLRGVRREGLEEIADAIEAARQGGELDDVEDRTDRLERELRERLTRRRR